MSAPMIEAQPIRFADYDLVRMLGRGGMAEVWSAVKRWQLDDRGLAFAQALQLDTARVLADEKAINKPLAVKVMHPSLSEDEDYRQIWAAESSITMQFSSANIVSVFEVGEYEGLLYMAMERIDGVNLHDFHQRVLTLGGYMPLDIVVFIIHEVLMALFVAHEHVMAGRPSGIIHRDVKPGNVMVSSVGDIRLTDFGIARPAVERRPADLAPGTPRYMAPEQARGHACKASDLYAAGAILEELLTGRRFRDQCRTTDELLRTTYVIPPLERKIPPELDYLRRGLLHPDAAQRISSARAALSLIPSAFGHAKLKLAELYEKVVGMRSSGFTRNHLAAKPSFLFQRRLGFESSLTLLVPPRPVEISDDDQTLLFGRAVSLGHPTRVPPEGAETDAPLRRERDREIGRQHRAAIKSPPISHTSAGRIGRERPPTVTPTIPLSSTVSSFAGASSTAGAVEIDRTERQPWSTLDASSRPSSPVSPSTQPLPPHPRAEPDAHPTHASVVTASRAAEPVPSTLARRRPDAHASTAGVLTALVVAAALFAAGIATALVIQRAPRAGTSETRP